METQDENNLGAKWGIEGHVGKLLETFIHVHNRSVHSVQGRVVLMENNASCKVGNVGSIRCLMVLCVV